MTYATEAVKTAARPRTIVDLYDGVTHRYYSSSAFFVGSDFVEGRLISIGALRLEPGTEGIPQYTTTLVFADPDQTLFDLSIDLDWQIIVYHTFPFELASITTGLSFELTPERVPTFDKGRLSIKCVTTLVSNLGRLRYPVITSDDVAAFTDLSGVSELIGQTYPIYFGAHEQIDLEPIYHDGADTYYPFAVSASDATDPYTESNIEVFLQGGDGTRWIPLPRRWWYLSSSPTYYYFWEIGSETITRTGESTNWRLHWIKITEDFYLYVGAETDAKIRVNVKTSPPSGNRADGEAKKATTVIDVVSMLCDDYLSNDAEGNVGTAGYDSTDLTAARDVAEDYGVNASMSIDQAGDGVRIIQDLINNSVDFWATTEGKISASIWAETDHSAMQSGYSSETAIVDWSDCLDSISRPNYQPRNEVSVFNQQLVDTDAQTTAPLRRATFANTQLEKSASYLLGWQGVQKRRNPDACTRFVLPGPLNLSTFEPTDLALLTEVHSGLSATPVRIEQFELDFLAHRVRLTAQSLGEWTATNGHVLYDESTYERNLLLVTASLTAGSAVVALSGSVTASIGDIAEFNTASNAFCAKITVAPNNPGSGWQMTVDTNAPATEAAISAWRITQPASSYSDRAAFLCDTDDEFSDGEDGNVMLFR